MADRQVLHACDLWGIGGDVGGGEGDPPASTTLLWWKVTPADTVLLYTQANPSGQARGP